MLLLHQPIFYVVEIKRIKNINLTIDDDENAMTSAFISFSILFFVLHALSSNAKQHNSERFFLGFLPTA